MYKEDLIYLVCPVTFEKLHIQEINLEEQGEIINGKLINESGNHIYPITNGIPRFCSDTFYNKSWNYKWTMIDKGKGLNYLVADKNNLAYKIHDIFDRNSHDGMAYNYADEKVAIDLGCGVGQNSYRLLRDKCPKKMISVDLTHGVDIFREIMLKKFPEYRKNLLIVQANILNLPIKDESIDYVFSLGVLHHTGKTLEAIKSAARICKDKGHLNFWIYASDIVPYEAIEPNRAGIRSPLGYLPLIIRNSIIMFWIKLFRILPHSFSIKILKLFSSNIWYQLCSMRYIRFFCQLMFSSVMHPDKDYRFINLYDGYINAWQETWSESEIFPTLKKANIVIKGISDWRLGIWGVKDKAFYC